MTSICYLHHFVKCICRFKLPVLSYDIMCTVYSVCVAAYIWCTPLLYAATVCAPARLSVLVVRGTATPAACCYISCNTSRGCVVQE